MARLLLVDDDLASLAFMRAVLDGADHQVLTAGSGAEALEKAGMDRFDLAVVDVGLPDMSGLEVMERLVLTDPDLGVMIITADRSVETAVAALRRGALDYLVKNLSVNRSHFSPADDGRRQV